MKSLYYVNGKKVDLETYLEAKVTNDHHKKMLKQAKKYYEDHPGELKIAYMFAKDSSDNGYSLYMYYNLFTEEGKKMNEEFSRNKDKLVHREAGYGFLANTIIIILSLLFIYFCC